MLHLEFANENGPPLNLDIDVNPPSFPVSNRRYKEYWWQDDCSRDPVKEEPDYDGSNIDKRSWLELHRPVGWKTEWLKSEDMSDAASPGDTLRRAVRLRFFNNQEVLAERVSSIIEIKYLS